MKKLFILLTVVVVAMTIESCSSTKKLAKNKYGEDIEVADPYNQSRYQDDESYFRSSATYTSLDLNQARSGAMVTCKGDIASRIKSAVKGGTSIYSNETTKSSEDEVDGMELNYEGISESEYTVIVDEVLENIEILVNKVTRNTKTGKYTAYVTIQVAKDGIADKVINNPRLKGLKLNRQDFVNYLKSR